MLIAVSNVFLVEDQTFALFSDICHQFSPLLGSVDEALGYDENIRQFVIYDDCFLFINSQIFDGHNGNAAAVFSRDYLLVHVLSAIPRGLGRDEWLQALPRALVAGFVKTDKEFQRRGMKFVSYFSFQLKVPFYILYMFQ